MCPPLNFNLFLRVVAIFKKRQNRKTTCICLSRVTSSGRNNNSTTICKTVITWHGEGGWILDSSTIMFSITSDHMDRLLKKKCGLQKCCYFMPYYAHVMSSSVLFPLSFTRVMWRETNFCFLSRIWQTEACHPFKFSSATPNTDTHTHKKSGESKESLTII